MTIEQEVQRWVKHVESISKPARLHWCTGSSDEYQSLCEKLVRGGTFIKLNPQLRPNSFLCRTDVHDAAVDHQNVVVCSKTRSECSQSRQWAEPEATKNEVNALLDGSMAGRTMYVVPCVLGPQGSQYSRLNVTITDSPFVVVQLMLMYSVGSSALSVFPARSSYIKVVHSVGQPLTTGESQDNACKISLKIKERILENCMRVHCPEQDVAWPCNTKSKKVAVFPEDHYAVQFGTSLGVPDLVSLVSSTLAQKEGWITAKGALFSVTGPQRSKDNICAILPPTHAIANRSSFQVSPNSQIVFRNISLCET